MIYKRTSKSDTSNLNFVDWYVYFGIKSSKGDGNKHMGQSMNRKKYDTVESKYI